MVKKEVLFKNVASVSPTGTSYKFCIIIYLQWKFNPSSRKMKMTVHSIVLVSHSVIPLILQRIQTPMVFKYVSCWSLTSTEMQRNFEQMQLFTIGAPG